jgi:hypothetical protein
MSGMKDVFRQHSWSSAMYFDRILLAEPSAQATSSKPRNPQSVHGRIIEDPQKGRAEGLPLFFLDFPAS